MGKRFDVMSARPRKDSDKPFWHRVGTAWEGDRGISIVFDSLPIADGEGRVAVSLFEPRPREDHGRGGGGKSRQGRQQERSSYSNDPLDGDDVPFITCGDATSS